MRTAITGIVLLLLMFSSRSAFALPEGEPFSSGDRGNLLFEDGFESGGWHATKGAVVSESGGGEGPLWYMSQMQGEYSGQVVDGPARRALVGLLHVSAG